MIFRSDLIESHCGALWWYCDGNMVPLLVSVMVTMGTLWYTMVHCGGTVVTVVVPHFEHCGHRGATMVTVLSKLSLWLSLLCHCCATVVPLWCHCGFHRGHYKGHYGTGFEERRLL